MDGGEVVGDGERFGTERAHTQLQRLLRNLDYIFLQSNSSI